MADVEFRLPASFWARTACNTGMGLMVEIVNVRSNPRFSMLRDLTENVGKAMELTAGLLDLKAKRSRYM